MEIITSISNKKVKYVKSLHNKKARAAEDAFLVEGIKFVGEIPSSWQVELIVVPKSFACDNDMSQYGGDICVVSDHIFPHLCDTTTPQALLAVVKRQSFAIADIVCGKNPLVMILENISDPGNLGCILRIAHGLGLSGVILANCTDVFAPKAVRSSAGSIFHVPFAMCPTDRAIAAIRAHNISLFAASADAEISLYNADFTAPSAIIIGSEANGISPETLALSDYKVKIPVLSESLNASVACGIFAYEASRQRTMR